MSFPKLLILSLHGLSWDTLSPWLQQRRLPTFKRLKDAGASGEISGLLPTFVLPNWASFWTGVCPGRHAIFAFAGLLPSGEIVDRVDRNWLSQPTWAEIATHSGIDVALMFAPLTFPARSGDGCVVSAPSASNDRRHAVLPASLQSDLREHFGSIPHPQFQSFWPEGGFRGPGEIRQFIDNAIENITQTSQTAQYVLDRAACDIALIHLSAADQVQHALWHGADREHPAWDERAHDELGRFFCALDAELARLLDKVGPQAVLVFAEHGFGTCRKVFNLSRPLADSGLLQPLKMTDGRSRLEPSIWAVHNSAPSGGQRLVADHKALYISRSGNPSSGRLAESLREILQYVHDPELGTPIIRKVWHAPDLYQVSDCDAWDVLVLELADGYTARNQLPGAPLLRRIRANHDYLVGTHTPTGLWAFVAPGTRPGHRIQASILDLPPTILDVAEVDPPNQMQGRSLRRFDS